MPKVNVNAFGVVNLNFVAYASNLKRSAPQTSNGLSFEPPPHSSGFARLELGVFCFAV